MLTAPHKTGLVFFPAFDWAISPTHPEREERLLYTQDQIFEEGVLDIEGIHEFKPDLARVQDIERVHFCFPDVWSVTTESHFISAGGAKTVGIAVMEKEVERGFALVRPPGHHAMRVVHGSRGFCNINIEATMIEFIRARYGIDRVAIVDTDCHHGDGTQDIYWHDPDTLFISIHQDGRTLYPGSGFPDEAGGPTAYGTTVNIPLPPATSRDGYLYAVENLVLPMLDEFKPELIINSAGQDNHYTDPITNMNFCAQGYARLTELLQPDIAVLEGGYSIEGALPYVNLGIILALAGMDYSAVKEPGYAMAHIGQTAEVSAYIKRLCDQIWKKWRRWHSSSGVPKSKKPFATGTRRIFYDTDHITERQMETLKICSNCSGVLKIESSSDRGNRMVGIHIPRKACDKCRELGFEWYESATPKDADYAFLQNRPEDTYLKKSL